MKLQQADQAFTSASYTKHPYPALGTYEIHSVEGYRLRSVIGIHMVIPSFGDS
jgi:hypothetical protein